MNIYGVCKVFRVPHNKHLIDPLHARYYYCLHAGAWYRFTWWVASESETVTTFPARMLLIDSTVFYRDETRDFDSSRRLAFATPLHTDTLSVDPSNERKFPFFA